MSRLIFIILAIGLVYWLLKKTFRQSNDKVDEAKPSEEMVRCAQCGVHIPKSESWSARGNYFCSEAHQQTYTQSH